MIRQFEPWSTLEKPGNLAVAELLRGEDGFSRELERVQQLIDIAIVRCEAVKSNGNVEDLEYWWYPTQLAVSNAAKIIFSFDKGLDNFFKNCPVADSVQLESLCNSIRATKPSFINEAENYLFELSRLSTNMKDVHRKFISKYGWILNSNGGPHELTEKWVEEHLQNIKKDTSIPLRPPSKYDPRFDLLVKTASRAINFRDDKKKLQFISVELMDRWLDRFAGANDLNKEALLYLSFGEILDNLSNIEILKQKSMDYFKQKERLGIMVPSGHEDIFKSDFKKIEILNSRIIDGSGVRGFSACRGIVRGSAKIINDARADKGKILAGDILIASMTRPEYLPLMRRASAFVTNEGGISCHAAIVAREMNKPCVIGTKNATKIFKDGDLIEVDAELGIVKIISKAQNEN